MSSEIVIAIYRAKEGGEQGLRELLGRHVPVLREQGLATERAVLLLRSRHDPVYLEIFEWVAPDSAGRAHDNAAVQELWKQMGEVADFTTFSNIGEARQMFPHFIPVDGVVS